MNGMSVRLADRPGAAPRLIERDPIPCPVQQSMGDHAELLYEALERIVRTNAQRLAVGHDAIVAARKALAAASNRKHKRIDWEKEHLIRDLRDKRRVEMSVHAE